MSPSVGDIDKRLDLLMETAVSLDDVTLMHVVDAWQDEEETARREAWKRVKEALKQSGRGRLMDETRDRMSRWIGDAKPGSDGAFYIPGVTWHQNDKARLRADAAPAILDAAAVIIVGELLEQEDRTVLAGPFGARLSKAARVEPG
jgi:hypothetical protein